VLSLILTGLFALSSWLLVLEIRGRQIQVAEELARQGNLYLSETTQLIDMLSNQLDNLTTEQQRSLLENVRRHYPRFTALYILDKNGVVQCEATGGLPLTGLDLSREIIFQQTFSIQRVNISRPFISTTTGKVAITVAAPIWTNQQIAQIFMGEMDLTLLQRAIEQVNVGTDTISFIVDANGALVAYPDTQWVQERQNFNDLALIQDGMQGGSNFRTFNSPRWGQWMAGSVTPMAHHWSVVILQPMLTIAQPLILLVSLSVVAFTLSLALLVILVTRGVKRATQPIIALAQEMEGLSEGQYQRPAPQTGSTFREVYSLRSSFEGMVDAVIERDRLLEQRVVERTHQIQTIAAISEHLNSILDLDSLIEEVLKQIRANFNYPHLSFFLLEEGEVLRIRAASGAAGQILLKEQYAIPVDTERSLVAQAARTEKIVSENDITQSPYFLNCEHLPNTCSEMCVPISAGEHLIGIIDVQTEEAHCFDATEIDTFRSLANQVGVAIHNAQLYAEMEKQVVRRTIELTNANEELNNQLVERKRVEHEREILLAQVREQATQVREIMNSVPEAVLLLHEDGCMEMTNAMADELLPSLSGLQIQVGTARCIERIGNRSLPDLLASGPGGLWHEIKAGNRTYEAIARPVDGENQIRRFVMVIRDVTDERVAQRQVQQQERLAAVGQLAAGIAHDFNNIMAVILLYVDIMLNLPDLQARHRERLNTIAQQARRAADLIQQILDFSRRSVLERRPMDITPVIKEQVKLLERTFPENIAFHLSLEEGIFTVNADPTRLQQALMNLALNARDAMPDGGVIEIGIKTISADKELVRCINCGEMLRGDWVCIWMQDTGMGISPEITGRIFEPFFTTKSPGKGTGLGLAQVYGIAKQHEGHIDLSNAPGKGARFNLYLPLVQPSRPYLLNAEQGMPVMGNGQLLLVVEDEPVTRKAIVDGLNQLSYKTLAVNNGREALEALTQYQGQIKLVLSDVIMPEVSGIAMFRAMRQRGFTTPVVLMSGHPLHEEMEKLQAEGVVGWLPKPPNMERLSRIVALALRQGTGERG
jgi:signal transduction histidine kinase/CheY-like chemotaxis protein/putative methionine-R-sulfoxide reductase with GAF domain/HAMP domain-containing protein